MHNIKLQLPLQNIMVTQPFGENYLDFYKKLGMKGHNGIDFRAKNGCPIYATHEGKVIYSARDGGGGISVILFNKQDRYKTIYYHNLKNKVYAGQIIKVGDLIALADNTGKYTTGNHLHFGLKLTDKDGATINKNNGYKGAINPALYFKKNWDKSNAYHRYYREQEWWAEFKMRFKNPWLHKQLIKRSMLSKVFDIEFINALVYGGWDLKAVINPAMRYNWAYLKKDEYLKGKRPFS